MNKMDTRTLLLILAAVVGFAIINFGVELTASDVGDWLKSTFGEGYKKLLFVALLSCIFIAAAWPYFSKKGEAQTADGLLAMPFSKENQQLLGDAKWQLRQAETAKSLEFLEKIDSKTVQTAVLKLRVRWSNFKKEQIAGVLSPEKTTETRNQISHDIIQLIQQLEAVEPERRLFDFSKKEPHVTAVPDKEWNEFRAELLERYEKRYAAKIEGRIALSMSLSYTQEGMSERYVDRFFVEETKTADEVRGQLFAAFEKHKSLLLLGDPGAGKTTVLLDLALEILRRQADDPAAPVPVVFNLASWDENCPDFWMWLRQVLSESYGWAKPVAERLLLERRILPFLDGLDEIGRNVPPEEQSRLIKKCGEQLVAFLPRYGLEPFVVCSRRAELTRAAVDLPVKADILVNPLQPEQVKKALREALAKNPNVATQTAAENILHWIDRHEALRAALLTPFYFKIAEMVFDERSVQTQPPDDPEAVENWLTQQFIDKKLGQEKRYRPTDVRRWLGWLAANMNCFSEVKFELAFLQPVDLQKPWWFRVVGGLLGSLAFGLVFGLVFGLLFGLVGGLFFGLVGGLGSDEIDTADYRTWDCSKLLVWRTWRPILAIILFLASIISIIALLDLGPVDDASDVGLVIFFLVILLFLASIIALVKELVFDLVDELSSIGYFSSLRSPYQRISGGILFNMVRMTFMSLIIFRMIYMVFRESADWLLVLTTALFGGFWGITVSPVFKHAALRLCLTLEKTLPLRLVTFLNHAETNLRFLDKEDGGTWRFRHQILQDYFAEKWASGEWR